MTAGVTSGHGRNSHVTGIITPDLIAKASVASLMNHLTICKAMWMDPSKEFRQGYGDTVRVRVPSRFKPGRGLTITRAQLQRLKERAVPVKLDKEINQPWELTQSELTLDLVSMTEQVISPVMLAVAQSADRDAADMYKYVSNLEMPRGRRDAPLANSVDPVIATGRDLNHIAALLDNFSAKKAKRSIHLTPGAYREIAEEKTVIPSGLAGRDRAYTSGEVGMVQGFDLMWTQQTAQHTVGKYGSSSGTHHHGNTTAMQVNAEVSDGYVLESDDYDGQWTSTITLKSLPANSVVGSSEILLREGDIVQFPTLKGMNPQPDVDNRQVLAADRKFVVREDVARGSGTTVNVKVSPRIIPASAGGDAARFATVNKPLAADTVMVVWGKPEQAYREIMAFHKEAFVFVMATHVDPKGSAYAATRSYMGFSASILADTDFFTRSDMMRADILYGFHPLTPHDLACRTRVIE